MKPTKLLTIAFLFLLPLSGCKQVINALAFHPDNVNVIPTSELPADIQEVPVTSEDGVVTTSLYLPSPESDKLVIYFHGNAGNIYHRIPMLRTLRGLDINVIGVSYRGYGKSDGEPSEQGVNLDGKAIYEYATEQMGFSKENIIIFGRSIGTTVAINTAQHERILGLILVSPLTNAEEQARMGEFASVASLARNTFDNISKIDKIEAPLLVVHGTNDQVIPFSMGREIFDRASAEKTFVEIRGGGHNNLDNEFEAQYWLPILGFINDA